MPNQYQGMVESAIKNSISLSDYFGDVNNVSMVLELQVMNDDVLANGLTAYNQIYTIYSRRIKCDWSRRSRDI
ncbi:MAG: hypothetical protein ACLUUG_12745 [Lachnospiraceae bacterium]